MSSVEAIYTNGVFRPLGDVAFAENQRVRLTIEPSADSNCNQPIRTAQDLIDSNLIGIWADRDDIQDSRQFARDLRSSAETRGESGRAAR